VSCVGSRPRCLTARDSRTLHRATCGNPTRSHDRSQTAPARSDCNGDASSGELTRGLAWASLWVGSTWPPAQARAPLCHLLIRREPFQVELLTHLLRQDLQAFILPRHGLGKGEQNATVRNAETRLAISSICMRLSTPLEALGSRTCATAPSGVKPGVYALPNTGMSSVLSTRASSPSVGRRSA